MEDIATPFERMEIRIMEAGRDRVDSSWHRFVTFFPYYRMYYIVSGHAVIYLQDKVLALKPGKMYYIPAFSVFTLIGGVFFCRQKSKASSNGPP